MDTVTQNQSTVHCEVLTESGVTAAYSSGHSDIEQREVKLGGSESGQSTENSSGVTAEDSSRHSDT